MEIVENINDVSFSVNSLTSAFAIFICINDRTETCHQGRAVVLARPRLWDRKPQKTEFLLPDVLHSRIVDVDAKYPARRKWGSDGGLLFGSEGKVWNSKAQDLKF